MSKRLAPITLFALLIAMLAAPAVADEDHGHDHADAIIWDGEATQDCSVADPGTIAWS